VPRANGAIASGAGDASRRSRADFSLFRAAHTVKGNASLLEFNALARFLHNVEDLAGSLPQPDRGSVQKYSLLHRALPWSRVREPFLPGQNHGLAAAEIQQIFNVVEESSESVELQQ